MAPPGKVSLRYKRTVENKSVRTMSIQAALMLPQIEVDHLKDFVEVLKRYLGTIADSVMDFPEEKKFSANRPPPSDEEQKLQEMGEPSGLIAAIEGFIDKVGELGAKLVEFSKGLYETVAEGLGALMSGTGRLIAAASSRFSRVKALCASACLRCRLEGAEVAPRGRG